MIESGSTKSLELHNSCRKGERDSLTWISFPLSGCGAGQLESSYHVVFFLNKYETNLLLLGFFFSVAISTKRVLREVNSKYFQISFPPFCFLFPTSN